MEKIDVSADKTTPRVSVTMTTYNRLHYLPKAIESVLTQTYRDFELIVVENGSTDGTKEWLAANPHPNLRVIDLKENVGVFGGMNTGIGAATGEYLTWLGSDDYFANYHLEAFVAALDSAPGIDYAYSPFFLIDEAGAVFSLTAFNIMIMREIMTSTHRGNTGFMYKRSLHSEIGFFEGASERLFWAKILGRYNCIYVMEPTIYYRVHKNSASQETLSDVIGAGAEITRQFCKDNNETVLEAMVSDSMIMRLYPILSRNPAFLPEAISDLACRLFHAGLRNEALIYLKVTISKYGVNDLLRPMLNFISLTRLINLSEIEIVKNIGEAIDSNPELDSKQRLILKKTASSLIALSGVKTKQDLFFADSGQLPIRYEAPNMFSYMAWKSGSEVPPLPTY